MDDQGASNRRQLRPRQYERMLRLMVLLQKRHTARTEDLCEELDVSLRTLQRDISRLRSRGVQISSHWHYYALVRPWR